MKEIKTTGQLREVLALAISQLQSGAIGIDQANAMHKLSKNITDSLYSETKIKMFEHEIGSTTHVMGDLPIGGSKADE